MMLYVPWVALLITMVGWSVVHIMASRRQGRQELRDFISNLTALIYEFQDLSIEYWLKDGRDQETEAKMIHRIGRIRSLSYILSSYETEFNDIRRASMELKNAATGASFETSERISSPEQINKIRISTSECSILLEKTFFTKFR